MRVGLGLRYSYTYLTYQTSLKVEMAESNNSERQGIGDCVQPGFEFIQVRVRVRVWLRIRVKVRGRDRARFRVR